MKTYPSDRTKPEYHILKKTPSQTPPTLQQEMDTPPNPPRDLLPARQRLPMVLPPRLLPTLEDRLSLLETLETPSPLGVLEHRAT